MATLRTFGAAATARDEAVAVVSRRTPELGWLLLSGRCDIDPPLGRCICGASSVEVAPALKEEAEVGRRLGVMAAHTPPPRRLSAIKIALLVEQNPEVERGIAIPPQLRALIRRRRGSELTALMQQHTQVERTPGIPRLVSTAIRQLRMLRRRHWLLDAAGDSLRSRPPFGRRVHLASALEVAAALKEEAEVGRRLGVMAAHTPPPRRLSAIKVALLVEQNPQVERGIAIPPQLRALIRRRRGSEVTALMEQHTQVERTPGIPRLVSTAIRQLRVLALVSVIRVAIWNDVSRSIDWERAAAVAA